MRGPPGVYSRFLVTNSIVGVRLLIHSASGLQTTFSELHSVGLVVAGKAETRVKVFLHEGSGLISGNSGHNSGIDGLLHGSAIGGNSLLLGAFSEESLRISLLGRVAAGEHLVGDLGDINLGNVDLGGGGDGVNLVDALEGNTVPLVRAGYKQETRLELLKEDNAMATEATGGKDEDGASLDALAELGGVCLLDANRTLLFFGGVPVELFDH